MFGIDFFKMHFNISDLFTFICPHVILAGYFFPVKTEELSNCKLRGRPMPSDIPFLPKTEPRCHSAHLSAAPGAWVAGGLLHAASPGQPRALALQARAVQPHFLLFVCSASSAVYQTRAQCTCDVLLELQ